MPYVWFWPLIAQLLLLLPNRWKVSLHCREGSTLSAYANACVMCVFRFSRVFSRRPRFILFLQQRFTPAIILNDSSSVLINHGIVAILTYVNRELTNTLVVLMSPRGPYGREEERAMRYYSGGFGQQFLAIPSALGWTWLLGKKCKYNCARISRLYLAPNSGRTLPPRIARHCDPLRLRIFAPRNVRSLQPSKDSCSPHLMMYIS